MNRFLSLTIISLIFTSSLFAQSKKQIKELKIKSATETVTLYKDGKEVVTYKSDYSVFDKEGNTTTEIEYNQNGTIKRKETTKYIDKNKVEQITEHPTASSDDGDNNDPKKYKKTTWKYNTGGDKTEEIEYDAAGNVTKKTTYAYNAKGDRTFEMEFDGAGKLVKKVAYGYDSKGLKTEKKVFGPGDVLEKHIKYTYTY